MNEITRPPPSGYRVEQAMAAWASARARLLSEDSALEHDQAALDELLGDAEGDVEDVLARLLRAARDAKAMAEASAGLIEDMQARKARFQRRNEAFRATAFSILDALGRSKYELPDITASIRAGQPSVQIVNEEEIPDLYVELVRKIDRQTIASVLKSGGEVPGAVLTNSLPSLSLRVEIMNAITKAAPHVMVLRPQSFGELVQFAQMAAKSSMVPPTYKGQPESIMLAIQMGSELGLAPMQSLQNIAVVNGRPTVWGDAVVGLCRQSPVCKDIVETFSGEGDKLVATCTAIRNGAEPVVRSFSVEDAKKAGLWGKAGPWQQYPKRMLQMRARGFAVRDAFPDVLRGLITAEEAADIPVRDTFAGPTIEHAAPSAAPVRETSHEQTDSHPAAPKKQTVVQWLDALALELAAAEGSEEVDAILARSDVQTAQDKLRNGARDRLQHILDEAIRRTAQADDAAETEAGDALFADPSSDPFRQPVTA